MTFSRPCRSETETQFGGDGLQVFTDIRYWKADNEHFSASYLEVIRKQGFTN